MLKCFQLTSSSPDGLCVQSAGGRTGKENLFCPCEQPGVSVRLYV